MPVRSPRGRNRRRSFLSSTRYVFFSFLSLNSSSPLSSPPSFFNFNLVRRSLALQGKFFRSHPFPPFFLRRSVPVRQTRRMENLEDSEVGQVESDVRLKPSSREKERVGLGWGFLSFIFLVLGRYVFFSLLFSFLSTRFLSSWRALGSRL